MGLWQAGAARPLSSSRPSFVARAAHTPIRSVVACLVFGLVFVWLAATSAPLGPADDPRFPVLVDTAVAYYLPTDLDSRRIHSVFGSGLLGASLVRDRRLTVYGGVMTTAAWGSIVQWGEDFERVRFETRAGGAGPSVLVRGEPVQRGRVSLRLEIGGSAIFYRPDFPPGGDFYNFAWQLGAAVAVRVSPRVRLGLGLRWMHVSNAQGLGPQNPSYEGVGLPISVDWDIRLRARG